MLWDRTASAPGACRTHRTTAARHHHRRTATAQIPVFREPETGWWATQLGLDDPAALTVAAVRETDAGVGSGAVASRLAGLATDDELLVVLGAESDQRPGHWTIDGLRDRLPRHDVVALGAALRDAPVRGRAAANLLEEGSLPVIVTSVDRLHDVTAELASFLRADRVVRVFPTGDSAELYQVWRRTADLMTAN